MSNDELERARGELQLLGADLALLSSIENVTYVTHWAVPLEFGALAAQHFVPPLAMFDVRGSGAALLTGSHYTKSARAGAAVETVASYDVFSTATPVDARANFLSSLRTLLRDAGCGQGAVTLAVDERTLPWVAARLISEEFPSVRLMDAGPALEAARLTKTPRELALLRNAAEVNRAGHEELLYQIADPGKDERELWAGVVLAMERKAAQTLHVFGELVSGVRCRSVAYPGGPTDAVPRPGDLVLMDMSPRVEGYWSDTTNTMVAGGAEPTRKQKLYGTAAREAFHAAAEALRPGRPVHGAYDAAEAVFSRHRLSIGHHAGHQIGTTVNENPRLVPYEQTTVRAGMVFSIETGAYEGPTGEVGARMEKSVIVHDAGPEVICDFRWGF